MMRNPSHFDFEQNLKDNNIVYYNLKKVDDSYGFEVYKFKETEMACKIFTNGYIAGSESTLKAVAEI